MPLEDLILNNTAGVIGMYLMYKLASDRLEPLTAAVREMTVIIAKCDEGGNK